MAEILKYTVCFALLLTCFPAFGQDNVDALVEARSELQTPDEDSLLYQLEKDYVKLLRESEEPQAILNAEDLLAATNDNTHWTNYAKATSLIRNSPSKAAIPLLLRYMVLHTERSSRHVMIPEYARTITLLSGREIEKFKTFENADVRDRVREIVDQWWTAESAKKNSDDQWSEKRLAVIASAMLEQVNDKDPFRSAGGRRDTAYNASQVVSYEIRNHSSSRSRAFVLKHVYPGLAKHLLRRNGYSFDGEAKPSPTVFHYEAIKILAELAKNGHRKTVLEIANDQKQNHSVRLACIFSMFRAGEKLDSKSLIAMLKEETNLERRLLMLSSLRWAGEEAKEVLLENMRDPNIEIATAAAKATEVLRPKEALPIFRELLLGPGKRGRQSLLASALTAYQSDEATEILRELLVQKLENSEDKDHVHDVLGEFIDAADLKRISPHSPGYDARDAARLSLTIFDKKRKSEERLANKSELKFKSLTQQISVAHDVYLLRKAEYRRLLLLQADEVITAAESKVAYDAMKQAEKEVLSLEEKILPLKAKFSFGSPD